MAHHADAEPLDELEEMLAYAGDGELLFVQRYLIDTLRLQAQHEGCSIGDVLDRALRAYLDANEAPQVMAFMNELAKRHQ